jgi:hypothetical protein
MSNENTQNLDKLAEELSDYLNQANKMQPETKETLGCGKSTVYKDFYDTIDVDPKTLNIECNFLDRSLDMYMITIFNDYLSLNLDARKNFFDFLNDDNNMNYHTKLKLFFKNYDIYDIIQKVYNDLSKDKKTANTSELNDSIIKILNMSNNPEQNPAELIIINKIIFLFVREISGTIYYIGVKKRDHSTENNSIPSLETAIQIIEYIKRKLEESNKYDKSEINLNLIYSIVCCLKSTEIIQEFLSIKFLLNILNIVSGIRSGHENDINNYPEKLKNTNDFFNLPPIPNSNNSNVLTIQEYNNRIHIFIDFDNNNHLIVTTYIIKVFNVINNKGDKIDISFLLNKVEYNITKNTKSEYNKIYWIDDRLKNPENTFIVNLDNIIQGITPTTGGRRKPRKTVKRKKNTIKKRKCGKSRKIMRHRRLRSRS